jgi:hypothetical protein
MRAKGTMVMLSLAVGLLGLTAASDASPIGVYVNDDFTTATVDPAEWITGGSGSVVGAVDGSILVITADAWIWSIDKVAPDAGQTVSAKADDLYTWEWNWGVETWGLLSEDENDSIYLRQTRLGAAGAYIQIMKDGVTHERKLANEGTNISGDYEIQWTPGRVVLLRNGGVMFDTDVDAPSSGSWEIPTDTMGLYAESSLNENHLEFGAMSLEVIPEPATMLLLGAGGLGLIRRKR